MTVLLSVGRNNMMIRNNGSVADFECRGGGPNFMQILEKS